MKAPYTYKSSFRRSAAYLLDACGYFLLRLVKPLLAPRPAQSEIRKILIVRLDHIGDLIMTRPAVRLLRQAFPAAKIDWLVPAESKKLLEDDPSVTEWIPFEHHWFARKKNPAAQKKETAEIIKKIKSENYDVAIDFRGDFRNILLMFQAGIPRRLGYGITGGGFLLTDCRDYDKSIHQVELNSRLLEPLGVRGEARFLPLKESSELFSSVIPQKTAGKRRVLIHPGAGYDSKLWPADNFLDLIFRLIREANCQVVMVGTRDEKNRAPFEKLDNQPWDVFLDLRGKISLSDLALWMNQSDLFIGSDSGPAHIAAAQKLPVICLFSGANAPEVWKPWTRDLTLLTHPVSCSPCALSDCPLPGHPCMSGIRVEDVYRAASDRLKSGALS